MAKSTFSIKDFSEGLNPKAGEKDQSGEGHPFSVGVCTFDPGGALTNCGSMTTSIGEFASTPLLYNFKVEEGAFHNGGGSNDLGDYTATSNKGHNGEGLYAFQTDYCFNMGNVSSGTLTKTPGNLVWTDATACKLRLATDIFLPAGTEVPETRNPGETADDGDGAARTLRVASFDESEGAGKARWTVAHNMPFNGNTDDDARVAIGNVGSGITADDTSSDWWNLDSNYSSRTLSGESNGIVKGDLFLITLFFFNPAEGGGSNPAGTCKVKFGGTFKHSTYYFDTPIIEAETVHTFNAYPYTGTYNIDNTWGGFADGTPWDANFNVDGLVAADDPDCLKWSLLVESPLDYTDVDAIGNDTGPVVELEWDAAWNFDHRVHCEVYRVKANDYSDRKGGLHYTGLVWPSIYGNQKRFGLTMWDGHYDGPFASDESEQPPSRSNEILDKRATTWNWFDDNYENASAVELDTGWPGIRVYSDILKASWTGLGNGLDAGTDSTWDHEDSGDRFLIPTKNKSLVPVRAGKNPDISYDGGFLRISDGSSDPAIIGKIVRTFMTDIDTAKHSICYDYFCSKLNKITEAGVKVQLNTGTSYSSYSSIFRAENVNADIGRGPEILLAARQPAAADSTEIPDELQNDWKVGVSMQFDDDRSDGGITWGSTNLNLLDPDTWERCPEIKFSFAFNGQWQFGFMPGYTFGQPWKSTEKMARSKTDYYDHSIPMLGAWDPRAVGFSIWISAGDEDPYRLADVDFISGRYSIPAANVFDAKLTHITVDSRYTDFFETGVHLIEAIPPRTYNEINGWLGTETTRARYRTSAVVGSIRYIGYVTVLDDNGKPKATYPDRILYSPPFGFDVFPALNFLGVVENDGDDIVKLMAYESSLVVFKRSKVIVIDTAAEEITNEYTGNGILNPNQACVTRHGVCWINNSGVHMFDGSEIVNLTTESFGKKINPISYNVPSEVFNYKDEGLISTDEYGEINESLYPVVGYSSKDDHLVIGVCTGGRQLTITGSGFINKTTGEVDEMGSEPAALTILNRPGIIYDFSTETFALQRYMMPHSVADEAVEGIASGDSVFQQYGPEYDLTNMIQIMDPKTRNQVLCIGKITGTDYDDFSHLRLFAYESKTPATNGLMTFGVDNTTNTTELSEFYYETADIDFDAAAQRKKVYKIYITYKTNPKYFGFEGQTTYEKTGVDANGWTSSNYVSDEHSCINVEYKTDASADWLEFEHTNGTNIGYTAQGGSTEKPTLDGTGGEWKTISLIPASSINNIQHIKLRFRSVPSLGSFYIENHGDGNLDKPQYDFQQGRTAEEKSNFMGSDNQITSRAKGMCYADIEITDITFVYRVKNVK
jgi:hypothetical protein